VLRKVGTLSPFFKALPPALILSTPSIEFLKSKIQTALQTVAQRHGWKKMVALAERLLNLVRA
jgi:hypothetical protein